MCIVLAILSLAPLGANSGVVSLLVAGVPFLVRCLLISFYLVIDLEPPLFFLFGFCDACWVIASYRPCSIFLSFRCDACGLFVLVCAVRFVRVAGACSTLAWLCVCDLCVYWYLQ